MKKELGIECRQTIIVEQIVVNILGAGLVPVFKRITRVQGSVKNTSK